MIKKYAFVIGIDTGVNTGVPHGMLLQESLS